MTNADIINRIKQLIESKKMSVNMLATKSDLAQSTLSSMMNRENVPSIPTLIKICEGLNITPAQFFMNESDLMITLTESQEELLETYNSLSPKNQQLAQELMKTLLNNQSDES